MRFKTTFFFAFLFFFLIETAIALFINDTVIRPFIGDVLVVICIYFFLRSFLPFSHLQIVIAVLVFSFLVEIGQYFNLIKILKLNNNRVARIIIGTTFCPADFLAYFIGGVFLFVPGVVINAKKRRDIDIRET